MRIKTKIFLFLFLVSIIFLGLFSHTNAIVETSQYQADLIDGQKFLTDPISPNHGILNADPSATNIDSILIAFNKSINSRGFSLFFYGNLHSVSSFSPSDFQVYYKDNINDWHLADTQRKFRSADYQLIFKSEKEIKEFRIDISSINHENRVEYGNLKIFTNKRVNVFQAIVNYFVNNNKSIFSYFVYSLIFITLLLLPGLVLVSRLRQSIDIETKLVLSPIFSTLILVLVSIFGWFTSWNIANYTYIIIIAFSLWDFIHQQIYKTLPSLKFIFLLIILAICISSLLQIQRDYLFNLEYIEKYLDGFKFVPKELGGYYFGYFADSLLQWGNSRILLNHVNVFSDVANELRLGLTGFDTLNRTPLLPFIISPILSLFGESHFIYQRFINALTAFYYVGIFFAVKNMISEKIGKIISLMILLSVPLTFSVINTEIYMKLISLYPIFISIGLIYKPVKEKLFSIILIASAFLIHPMNAITGFISGLLPIINRSLNKKNTQLTISILIPLFVIVSIWFIVTQNVRRDYSKDNLKTGNNIYITMVFGSGQDSLANRGRNIINVFVPDYLFRRSHQPSEVFLSDTYVSNYFLRNSIIAYITPLLFLYGIIRFLLDIKKKQRIDLLYLGLTPIVIFILMQQEYSFGSSLLFSFCVPIILAFILDKLLLEKLVVRTFLVFSYVLTASVMLYKSSGIFIRMKSSIWEVHFSFYILLLFFCAISLGLMAYILRYRNSKN